MRDDKGLGVPAGAGPRPSNAQVLLALADRCEREEASVALDTAIGNAIGNYNGALWWTRNMEDTMQLSDWVLLHASNIDMPVVRLGNPGTDQTAVGLGGRTLRLTWCAAALRACAADAGVAVEEQGRGIRRARL